MALIPLVVVGVQGLGDNVYQRPFVRELARDWEVYIETPWPQLYADLGVRAVRHPDGLLRTQQKNMRRAGGWAKPPEPPYYRMILGNSVGDTRRSIIESYIRQVPVPDVRFQFDLPPYKGPKIDTERPLAVVRPVTVRREWMNPARAPKPVYVAQAARILKHHGFHVVSVADVAPPDERFIGTPPEADTRFEKGELSAEKLIGLIQRASVVVGGVGWIVPMATAAGTPLVVIGGGNGMYNHPGRVTDRRMDLSRVRWITPDSRCMCGDMQHKCNKDISRFGFQFERVLGEVAA